MRGAKDIQLTQRNSNHIGGKSSNPIAISTVIQVLSRRVAKRYNHESNYIISRIPCKNVTSSTKPCRSSAGASLIPSPAQANVIQPVRLPHKPVRASLAIAKVIFRQQLINLALELCCDGWSFWSVGAPCREQHSLVRDVPKFRGPPQPYVSSSHSELQSGSWSCNSCLLYTSDAADERLV